MTKPPALPESRSRNVASNLPPHLLSVRVSTPMIVQGCRRTWTRLLGGLLTADPPSVLRWVQELEYSIGQPRREEGLEPIVNDEILARASCTLTVTLLDLERDIGPVARWALRRKMVLRCIDARGCLAWVPALKSVGSLKEIALAALIAHAMLRPNEFPRNGPLYSTPAPTAKVSGLFPTHDPETMSSEPAIPLVRRKA